MQFTILFLFFGIFSALHAEWDQLFSDEEDPSLYHHVNVITGNLNLCIEDGVIQGAKTLPLFRTYSSAGALESPDVNMDLKLERNSWIVQGGWNFLPHTNLWIDLSVKLEYFRIDFFRNSICLLKHPFLVPFLRNFSTLCSSQAFKMSQKIYLKMAHY